MVPVPNSTAVAWASEAAWREPERSPCLVGVFPVVYYSILLGLGLPGEGLGCGDTQDVGSSTNLGDEPLQGMLSWAPSAQPVASAASKASGPNPASGLLGTGRRVLRGGGKRPAPHVRPSHGTWLYSPARRGRCRSSRDRWYLHCLG